MESDNLVKQGILLFPPQGMIGQIKKIWHKKFCKLFKPSLSGIKRLEIYDNQDEALAQPLPSKCITLEACIKICPSSQPYVFTVQTKTHSHDFGCSSEDEMATWMTAFRTVAFEDILLPHTFEEDNDLYCTSGEGVFAVKLVETIASKNCGLQEKNYTLIIAASHIKLMDGEEVLFTWDYRFIRKYGYRDGKFTFEAGRKCDSGAGLFSLEHNNQQEIFKCISSKIKSMKKLLSGDSSIDFHNAQYHAALSMEAGSRSPLPPSPNSSGNVGDLDFSTISQNSQKHSVSSSSSVDSVSMTKPPPPTIKPKPAKPPRKNMFTAFRDKKSLEYINVDASPCGKYSKLACNNSSEMPVKNNSNTLIKEQKNPYDSVEVRSDAWKTHGVDIVPHTENPSSPGYGPEEGRHEAMEAVSFSSQGSNRSKTSVTDMAITPTCPIIHNNISSRSDPPNYDKLQHFGSTHKLNLNSGYRTPNVNMNNSQVNPLSLPPAHIDFSQINNQWGDYEVVEDMSPVRLADDSSHGYGVIKKLPPPPNIPGPNHKTYGDQEYAIISKPKRV